MLPALVTLALLVTLPPRTNQMIYDRAGVIDDAAEQRLERDLHELYAKTGVAIVVLTVPRLGDETIDQLAVRAGQSWGVGKRGEDKGLVIAFSRDDRKIFVATGYGTEGYLPDGRIGAMIDRYAIPAFKQNRFSEGLVGLTDALVAASAREFHATITGVDARMAEPSPNGGGGWAWIVGGIVLFLLFVFARRSPFALAFLGSSMFHGPGSGTFRDGGGFGGGFGGGGFGGGGFGGGGAGRSF